MNVRLTEDLTALQTSVSADEGRRHWRRTLGRYTVVALTVGAYIGLGFLLRGIDANAYLLLGMPITVAFQRIVARRSLRELWLNGGQETCIDRWTWVLLVCFLIGPGLTIYQGAQAGQVFVVTYAVAALFGAAGAALAVRVLGRWGLRQLGLLLVLSVPIMLVRLVLQFGAPGGGGFDAHELSMRLLIEIQSLLFYVPAVFVAEEVFFRGALDSYLHRHESGDGWLSAAYVSVLWGLWHAPLVGSLSVAVIVELVVAQLVIGLLLSWLWRKTGNLAMSGGVHAIIDAVRNALLA